MLLCFYAFALSGRECDVLVSHTQGAASLALVYVLHWAFSPRSTSPSTDNIGRAGVFHPSFFAVT